MISLERRLLKVVPRKNQKGGGGSDGGNGKKVRARWNLSDVNLADGYVDTWGVTLSVGYSVGSDIGLISSGTNPINDLYCIPIPAIGRVQPLLSFLVHGAIWDRCGFCSRL